MSMRGRIALGASLLAVLVVFFLLFRVATQPSYTMLMSGLDPAKTGEITTALDAQGIPYELQNNGTALAVEKAATAQARVALAAEGLGGAEGGAGQPGFEDLMSEQKLGTSDFQQRVTYQRALEGEIAKTIEGVSGVGGARVQLTLPEDDLFADESKPATASVLLGGSGDAIEPAQVKGIASLVSGAVEGLKKDDVTITDSSGQLLWPQGDGAAGAESGATTKTAAEARYAAQLEGSLMAMLERTLGPGKAQVVVRPDLDVDDATREELTYDRRGVPQRQTTEEETLEGTGGAGATAGATANIEGARNGAAGGESNYEKRAETTDWALNKTVERRRLAPGTVRRLDVALVLDQSVNADLAQQLERTVATAAGVQADRGDTIEMTQLAMAKAPAVEATTGPLPAGVLGYLKWAALALAGIVFLALVTRGLRRREGEALGPEPRWLREIEGARPVAELAGPVEAPTVIRDPRSPSRKTVEELAKDDPERIASQLRSWMREEELA